MDRPLIALFDDVLLQVQTSSPQRVLFWGDGVGGICSYVAGWMAGRGIEVILLDGGNHFNPYMAASFARGALMPPEDVLKRIRIARAFTCYQMATLIGERLVSLVETVHAVPTVRQESSLQVPWVIILGPITPFLDEDVPEREIRPLFERTLERVQQMTMAGIPFFLFQPSVSSKNNPPFIRERGKGLMESRRSYLIRRLFQLSDPVWKIDLEDQGPKLILEKGSILKSLGHSVISHSMT